MSPNLPPIILASSSHYRKQLLDKLGLTYTCISPLIDESRRASESIPQMVARLARSKAQAIAKTHPHAIIIGSDQSASLNHQALGKAGEYHLAFEQLRAQSEQCVDFFTGLAVYNPTNQSFLESIDHTQVCFRQLNDTTIHNYLIAEQPYDCAGSFKSEGLGICLFKRIQTQDPNALIGLPLIQLVSAFETMGISLPITRPAIH